MDLEERSTKSLKDEKDLDHFQLKSQENASFKTFVKYVEPKLNITNNYKQLAEKTNLNLAPSNWLNEFLPGSFLPQVQKNAIDHSSLLMAGRYPELLADVDVVSASKHIKKLLKTPFNMNSTYSMSVHRIKNSLFIDDLDIPSFIKLNQYDKGDLSWLYKLYCSANNVSNEEEIRPKKKNKELTQQQLMQSKFLYHSIAASQEENDESIQTKDQSRESKRSSSICLAETTGQPSLSSSTVQKSAIETGKTSQDFPSGSYYMHDVLWTFEDITMLVGSDLPIFGGGRYPAVSLRLHDASKPINILTGMDYWLDNLMCNVPELMMCYHLNGIVQKYETLKTVELPSMEGSQFSPNIIKDVAQNILSFLKANCTKEGHTYWLFKSNKEDIVKLYDLTSIAAQNDSRDPFGTSVGFLLYKIAFNMYISCKRTEHNILKMVALLDNCIKILWKERCKELLAMANFLLSDLYAQSLSTTTSTIDVNLSENSYKNDDSSYTTDDESVDSNDSYSIHTSIDVKTLCDNVTMKRSYEKYEYINKNLDDEEKCKNAIQAVIEVLNLLYPLKDQPAKCEKPSLELSLFSDKINENLLTLPENNGDKLIVKPFSMDGMKERILKIAVKSYLTLVRISLSKEKFGRSLRFLSIIFIALQKVRDKNLCAQALMYYGDTITMLASTKNLNIDLEKERFLKTNKEDGDLLKFINNDDDVDTTTLTGFCNNNDVGRLEETFDRNFEELLLKATEIYQQSFDNIENEAGTQYTQVTIDILRRHANILNELGVLYMNKAASIASAFGVPKDTEIKLWKISYNYFEKGIKTFDAINDRSNMALLCSNTGKLMRLCAQVYGNSTKSCATESRGQFTQQEETYFNKAFEFYNKGLALLSGNISPPIKDSLLMELAGAHLSMATLMQDNAPLQSMAEEKVVKQISSSLMKSLHYIENITSTQHDNKERQKQMALVHRKLGSLYHHVLRNQISDTGKKNYRSLAELHYTKVYNHYRAEDQPIDIIQVILEHIGLNNYLLAQNQSQRSLKSKLRILFDSEVPLFDAVTELAKREMEDQLNAANKTEVTKLLTWLFGQLNQTLKESIKYMNGKTIRNLNGLDIKQVKKMFEVVLRSGSLPNTLQGKLLVVCDVLKKLQTLYKEAANY